MRSLYLLAIAALLLGGAVAQDYASCIAACPQGGGAGYARGVCLSDCADQYSNQQAINVDVASSSLNDNQQPDYQGYKDCLAKCPNCGGCGYARQACQTECVDEFIVHRQLSDFVKKLNN